MWRNTFGKQFYRRNYHKVLQCRLHWAWTWCLRPQPFSMDFNKLLQWPLSSLKTNRVQKPMMMVSLEIHWQPNQTCLNMFPRSMLLPLPRRRRLQQRPLWLQEVVSLVLISQSHISKCHISTDNIRGRAKLRSLACRLFFEKGILTHVGSELMHFCHRFRGN